MNFDFLDQVEGLQKLKKFCSDAEMLAEDYPEASAISARKAIEYITKLIYTVNIGDCTQTMTVYEMLTDFRFEEYIGNEDLMSLFHRLRLNGNSAAHGGVLSREQSKEGVKQLHRLMGEMCVREGMIKAYPPYSDLAVLAKSVKEDADEPAVDMSLVLRFRKASRVRHDRELNPDYKGQEAVEKQISTSSMSKMKEKDHQYKGTSTAVNTAAAFQQAAEYLEERVGSENLTTDYSAYQMALTAGGKTKVIAVRTGCCKLAGRDADGEWIYMPGVDYVLYAAALKPELPVSEQLHLFKVPEFVSLWQDAKRTRMRISKSLHTRLEKILPEGTPIETAKYADEIAIQTIYTAKQSTQDFIYSTIDSMPTLQQAGSRLKDFII